MLYHKCVSVIKMAEIAKKSIIRVNEVKIENFQNGMNTLVIVPIDLGQFGVLILSDL